MFARIYYGLCQHFLSSFHHSGLIEMPQNAVETQVFPRIHYSVPLQFVFLSEFALIPHRGLRDKVNAQHNQCKTRFPERPSFTWHDQEFPYWCIPLGCVCVHFERGGWLSQSGTDWDSTDLTMSAAP